MRILLTGATGFVGSHLLRRLVDAGRHEVAALVRPGNNRGRIPDLVGRFTPIEGDLAGLGAVEASCAAFEPEAVVHLAWSGVGNRSRNDPRQADNVRQVLDLVELARRIGTRHWIGLGSQAEYGPCAGAIDEQTPTRPTTLYGVTKLCGGLLAGRLCAEHGMRFAWLRLFSSYGPGDDPQWMIPYLMLTLLRGGRPALTWAEQRWDYIYVADVAEAIARVAETPGAAGVYNLGSGAAHALRDIIERIRDRIDPHLALGFGEVPYRPDQVMHLQPDIGRLRRELGWSAAVGLDEGLERTLEWYRVHRARESA
jgi:UDP-glucose 4-epimerase